MTTQPSYTVVNPGPQAQITVEFPRTGDQHSNRPGQSDKDIVKLALGEPTTTFEVSYFDQTKDAEAVFTFNHVAEKGRDGLVVSQQVDEHGNPLNAIPLAVKAILGEKENQRAISAAIHTFSYGVGTTRSDSTLDGSGWKPALTDTTAEGLISSRHARTIYPRRIDALSPI